MAISLILQGMARFDRPHIPIIPTAWQEGMRAIQRFQNAGFDVAKLTDLSVSFLSLVARPATGKGLTLKSVPADTRISTFEIKRSNDELQRAYGIVYAPDQIDAHGDTADVLTIRRAAAEFMREGRQRNIDLEHSFAPEMAFVAETWLVRSGDPLFPDEPDGAWAAGIQINDPDLWRRLKSGELVGISLAGMARIDPVSIEPVTTYTEKTNDATPGWAARLIKALTGAEPKEETEMDANEVRTIVRDTLKSELGAAIKDAMTPEPATPANTDAAAGAADKAQSTPDIQGAIAKGFEALEAKLDGKIAVAVAKGVVEAGGGGAITGESFA